MKLFRLAALAAALPFLAAAPPDASRIEATLKKLSAITGLPVKRKVPASTMTRDEWNAYLKNEIARRVKPEEIRAEELVLKMLGLVPEEFDLKQSTIDLMTEQAAAFYDYRTRRMTFVESTGGMMEEVALIHELAHALADQHFNLKAFMDGDKSADDEQTARLAVVEGQAMWLTLEAPLRDVGNSLLQNRSMLEMAINMSGASGGMFPALEKAPLYLRESLMFPYREGLLFQHALCEKLGERAFAEALKRPPVTTQQILHPPMYFGKVLPVQPLLPELDGRKRYRELNGGSLGEFDVKMLLMEHGFKSDAAERAAAWRGGAYDLLETKDGKHVVLRWAITWESEQAAGEFFTRYRQVLERKSKQLDVTQSEATRLEGRASRGGFRLRREGAVVSALEGLP